MRMDIHHHDVSSLLIIAVTVIADSRFGDTLSWNTHAVFLGVGVVDDMGHSLILVAIRRCRTLRACMMASGIDFRHGAQLVIHYGLEEGDDLPQELTRNTTGREEVEVVLQQVTARILLDGGYLSCHCAGLGGQALHCLDDNASATDTATHLQRAILHLHIDDGVFVNVQELVVRSGRIFKLILANQDGDRGKVFHGCTPGYAGLVARKVEQLIVGEGFQFGEFPEESGVGTRVGRQGAAQTTNGQIGIAGRIGKDVKVTVEPGQIVGGVNTWDGIPAQTHCTIIVHISERDEVNALAMRGIRVVPSHLLEALVIAVSHHFRLGRSAVEVVPQQTMTVAIGELGFQHNIGADDLVGRFLATDIEAIGVLPALVVDGYEGFIEGAFNEDGAVRQPLGGLRTGNFGGNVLAESGHEVLRTDLFLVGTLGVSENNFVRKDLRGEKVLAHRKSSSSVWGTCILRCRKSL